ncbi:uncharacterized protein [Primulina huaijiensis]|uniref:uncharacterized protein n=1 Tax=Primulina huaijiensis TaxID=1492673 RepID=UPI003CC6EA35
MEDVRKIVVIVEDVQVARTALRWALENILRLGDLVILLHVYPKSRSRNKKKNRTLRLKGFQLALSFRDICNSFPNTKTEIVVTEGDGEGGRVGAIIREIGASTLVLGLHNHSFLYKLVMGQNNISINLNCKVLAIKEQATDLTHRTISLQGATSTNMDFSQIEVATLSVPQVPIPKIEYQICPDPNAIMWKSKPSRTSKYTWN